jgi:hypothetical protein
MAIRSNGNHQQRRAMKALKKIMVSSIGLALLLLFTGCGGGGSSPAGTPGPGTPDTPGPPEIPADTLSGIWGTGILASALVENSWERGTLTIHADASATYSSVTSKGSFTSASRTLHTSGNGSITVSGPGSVDLYRDSGGTVMHGAALSESGADGLYTALKTTGSYSSDDIAGRWKANVLVSGPSSPWWERGTITVDSNGNFTGSTVDIFGAAGYLTRGGSLHVSSDGLVTMASYTALEGVMDSHKTVIIWTDTWPNGTTELAVLTRLATSYDETDLVGSWKFSTLSTGELASIATGTMTVAADGTAVIKSERAGGSAVHVRKLLLSPDGAVTIDGMPDVEGAFDSGKTVMVFTEKLTFSGLPSGSAMTIFTK